MQGWTFTEQLLSLELNNLIFTEGSMGSGMRLAVFFGGSQWAAGLFEIAGKPSTFYFLVLLSEPFYYLYNTHLFELHLFVVKAEREECIVVAELRDTFP
ncbi:hypothetical protein ACLOJK_032608 [Asimina triloba]